MVNLARRLRDLLPVVGRFFSRPMVLFHTDDWGLVGIRDQEGFNELKARGVDLGDQSYDYYSLETAEDLHCLYGVLRRHRDSIGRPPCLVSNFILANVDFPRVIDSGFTKLHLLPLDQGFPEFWNRPGLLETYREGVQKGIIYPALHGLTHFCQRSVDKVMHTKDERNAFLRMLYSADTPMIPGRTPWVSFEYHPGMDEKNNGWLDFSCQRQLIGQGKRLFERVFGRAPFSACAPGYRANEDTLRGWAEAGIQVAQNGPGLDLAPYFDRKGLLHLHRNVPFEPAIDANQYDESTALMRAEGMIKTGRPAIVCLHSINFHSTLKNHRDLTLKRLDRFLTLIENRYKDLLYVHDFDLWQIIKRGNLEWNGQRVTVPVTARSEPSPALAYYLREMRKSLTPSRMNPFNCP
jgi:hypothetical protein